MNRRQFLSGLGAALVGWVTRGVKVEEAADQEAVSLPPGFCKIETNLDKFLGPIHVSEELLQDAIGPLPLHFSFPHGAIAWKWNSEDGFASPGFRTITTRVRHQVSHHASFIRDEARIVALYDVQGTEKRLVVDMWLSHEDADDGAVTESFLEWMDEEAEWAAAHPEEIPTAEWAWT